MDIAHTLSLLERGQGTQEDLEKLARFIQRASYFIGKMPGTNTGPLANPTLFSLIHAVTEIAAGLDIEQVALSTAVKINEWIPSERCTVMGWDPGDDSLLVYADRSVPDWEIESPWRSGTRLDELPFLRPVLYENLPRQYEAGSAENSEELQQVFRLSGASALVLIPISVRNRAIGCVAVLNRPDVRKISSHEMILVRLLANQAAVSIENAILYQDARQRSRELEAVRKASLVVTASLDLEYVLNAILESTHQLLHNLQDTHIFLYDGDTIRFGAARWSDGRRNEPWSTPRPEGLTYSVARSGEMILVKDIRNHPMYENAPEDWHGSIVGLPLKIGPRVVGVMTVARSQPGLFPEHELYVLRMLGDQASLVIENARLHNLISQQALTDALTSIPNRRHFDQQLEEEIRRSYRYSHRFALVILDLNHLKQINDTYGHLAGDRALQQTATLLRRSTHDTDFVSRYGGDEFALILPETDRDGAAALTRRILAAFAQTKLDVPEAVNTFLTAAAGTAVFPEDGTTAGELIETADQAMYLSKRQTPGR